MSVVAFIRKLLADHQNFFGMSWRNFSAGGDADPDTFLNGDSIPGLTDTESINITFRKMERNLRRWNDQNTNILVGFDTTTFQPFSEKKIV